MSVVRIKEVSFIQRLISFGEIIIVLYKDLCPFQRLSINRGSSIHVYYMHTTVIKKNSITTVQLVIFKGSNFRLKVKRLLFHNFRGFLFSLTLCSENFFKFEIFLQTALSARGCHGEWSECSNQ